MRGKGSNALRGDWDGLIRRLQNFQHDLEIELGKTVKQTALLVESVATGHLRDQDLPWASLKSAYLERKKRGKGKASRSLSEKILIATGTYFQSITSYVEGLTAFVGVKRGVAREEDGTDVLELARIHEQGAPNANIPERSLWKPTFDEVRPEIVRMFKNAVRRILKPRKGVK